MAVVIKGVAANSPAARKHILPGEQLMRINGHEIADVLDYRFFLTEPVLRLAVRDKEGRLRVLTLHKREEEDIGLEFDTYLMDKQRSCRNRCIFCFIDQLPPGMRESLYFKDDDSRLSFLFGNYITLTNLSDREAGRIVAMHISPINISVHTTNPELRCQIMGNRFAGDSLRHLKRFAQAGIRINCQLVLCPGVNDGEELRRTMADLCALAPAVESVAAVPVGVTRYREGLYPLRPYTPEEAAAVIDLMEETGNRQLAETGNRRFYPSDEFYLKAGRPLPPAAFYGEMSQLENGVGIMALLKEEFFAALEECGETPKGSRVTLATGVAAAPFIQSLVDEAKKKWHNLQIDVQAIRNEFFGETIDVAGLITGGDIRRQLAGQAGDILLIPDVMLRREGDCFLDDVTPEELGSALDTRVVPVPVDGEKFVQALLL